MAAPSPSLTPPLSPYALSEVEKGHVDALLESKHDSSYYATWVEISKGKKGDKVERLVASIGKFRLYLLKVGKKKAESLSELKYVTFKTVEVVERELKITDAMGTIGIQTDSALELAHRIKARLASFFPDNYAEIVEFKIPGNFVPEADRLPCGNLSAVYLAMCDLEGSPPREDIVWDIEKIFGFRKTTEFSLKIFTPPISDKDIRYLLLSLKYNLHFTSLELDGSEDGIPVEKEIAVVADVLRNNITLTSIKFLHIKCEEKIWVNIFTQLQQNTSSDLSSIEFEDCSWDGSSKSIVALSSWISSLTRKGLDEFILKGTGSSTRKTAPIFEALSKSSIASLTKLDLENHKLDQSAHDKLTELIRDTTALTDLNVSGTGISLPPLFNSLFESKIPVKTLNISGNKLQKKQTIQPILDYLMDCPLLESLDISSLEVNLQVLEKFLVALAGNKTLPKSFGLSINSIKLEKEGSETIARALITGNIRKLSLRSCDLGDDGLRIVLKGISTLAGLEELDVSLNLKHPKGPVDKDRELTVLAIAEFLDIRHNCLEIFKISGQRGSEIGPHLDVLFKKLAVGDNVKLTTLDVSGNNAGDDGASALAKYLEKSKTLKHLSYDRNNTSMRGLQWLRNGLMKNESLLSFEAPIIDIASAGDPDKIRSSVAYWKEIEEILRKRLPKTGSNDIVACEDEKKNRHRRRKSRPAGDVLLKLEAVSNSMTKSNPASPRKAHTPKSPRVGVVTSASAQSSKEREVAPIVVSPRSANLRASQAINLKEERVPEEKPKDEEKVTKEAEPGLRSSRSLARSGVSAAPKKPSPTPPASPSVTPTPLVVPVSNSAPLVNVSKPKGPTRRPPGRTNQTPNEQNE